MISTAIARAREEIKNFGIKRSSEIDIYKIAHGHRLIIDEEYTESHEGRVYYNGQYGVITINKNIRETGKKNFTIAHEVGHFLLDTRRHYMCKKYDIAMIKTYKEIENEANEFAAELLMPEEWYSEETGTIEKDTSGIKSGAEKFNVSLTASAIRYSQAGKTPIAVIMSEKGKVKWRSINKHFPFIFIPKGYAVNSYSSANDFYTGKPLNTEPEEIRPEAWFQEDANYKKYRLSREEITFWEQNIEMKKYNSVLTILWLKNIKG